MKPTITKDGIKKFIKAVQEEKHMGTNKPVFCFPKAYKQPEAAMRLVREAHPGCEILFQ